MKQDTWRTDWLALVAYVADAADRGLTSEELSRKVEFQQVRWQGHVRKTKVDAKHTPGMRLELTNAQVEGVANWDRVFDSLYRLWLDSGEYEIWAKSQLLLRDGQVNVIGMDARAVLGSTRPTYYWWFHDCDEEPQSCPWCFGAVRSAERHGLKQCDKCSVIV